MLRCGDIDFDRRKLTVSGSTSKGIHLSKKMDEYFGSELTGNSEMADKRIIFLSAFLVHCLKPVYGKFAKDCYLINGFPNKTYGVETVENKVRKIAGKCGFFDVDFLALRDTFGARCAENGLDFEILGAIMGADSVDIYYPAKKAEESPLEFLREAY